MKVIAVIGFVLGSAAAVHAQTADGNSALRWDAFAGVGVLERSVGPAATAHLGWSLGRSFSAGFELSGTASAGRHLEAGLVTLTLRPSGGGGAWIRYGLGLVNRPFDPVCALTDPCDRPSMNVLTGGFGVAGGFSTGIGPWRLGPAVSYLRVFNRDFREGPVSTLLVGVQLSRR